MASSVEERLEKNLECGICLESFQEPKVLPCQHTYCKKCLERIIFRASGGRVQKITCPECRVETKLQRGGVASLPSSFLIKRLLEVNSDAQLDTSANCEKHPEEPVDLYCDCSEPICRACAVIDHRLHSNQPLSKVFARERKMIATLLEKAKPQMSALKAEISSREGIEEALQQNCSDINEQIENFVNAKIAQWESKRESLKKDLREMSTSKVDSLKRRREALLLLVSRVENVKDIIKKCGRSSEKKVEFLRKKSQFADHLKELSATSQHIQPCNKVTIQLKEIHPLKIYPNGHDVSNQAKIRLLEFDKQGNRVGPSANSDFIDLFNNWIKLSCFLFLMGLILFFKCLDLGKRK